MTYTDQYLEEAVGILERLDRQVIERMVDLLASTRDQGGRVFFLGVGGGAGHASHAVCDFRKIGGMEAYAPSDNVSELTARINDDGWDTAYANWLRGSRISCKDLVFVFSVGGGDAQVADACALVRVANPATVTPHTEAFQALVWHLLVSHPRLKAAEMKWESIR
jgi:D-sedoheptulose 7-phosphate isomerase